MIIVFIRNKMCNKGGTVMKVNELTNQFGKNDKSPVTVIDLATEEIIFEDRIDYIQNPFDDEQEMIHESEIVYLDVSGGKFIIYIDTRIKSES